MNSAALKGVDLHDIITVPAAGFWPPAPGWWIVSAVFILLGYYLLKRFVRYWRQRRLLTRLLHELDTLSQNQPEQLVTNISTLLRRVALTRYPRDEVASLNGDAWLGFLDQTGGDGEFNHGIGQKLVSVPYAPRQQMSDSDNQALIILARKWLQQNCRHADEY